MVRVHVAPQMQKHCQYVVIGAGSGGLTVAVGLKKLNKNVLIISKNIGGECTFTGCVPSKSILHHAHNNPLSQDSPNWQQQSNQVLKKVRAKISEIAQEDQQIVQDIEQIIGEAHFIDSHTISVNNTNITFDKAIIAVGSSPITIDIPGVPQDKLLTNENIFELEQAPQSLTILGGGPIGCEMATAFSALGTKVRIVTRGKILPKDSASAVEFVRNNLLAMGVELYEDNEIKQINEKEIMLTHATIPLSEYYLIALGRKPNTSLNLENAGVSFSQKGIEIDTKFRTSVPHIYAIGDCTTSPKFTHLAYYQATKVLTQQISSLIPLGSAVLPWVTFTSPPIASVGELTENEHTKKFIIPFAQSDRAKIDEVDQLYGEIYVHAHSAKIVGVTIVGEHAEHLINFFTLAIQRNTKIWHLTNVITPYPTYANAMNKVTTEMLQWWTKRLPTTIKEVFLDNLFRLTALIFWIIVGTTLYSYLASKNFDATSLAMDAYRALLSEWGVLLFILLYCLRPFIMFSATILSAVAGSVYGFWIGLLLTIAASNLSSIVAYYLGQTVFASKSQSDDDGFKQRIRKNTFQATLTARLTYLPYDLVSYIAGSLRAPLGPFILATALGSIPGSIAIVSFGASIENVGQIENFRLDPLYIIIGLVALIFSFLLKMLFRKYSK